PQIPSDVCGRLAGSREVPLEIPGDFHAVGSGAKAQNPSGVSLGLHQEAIDSSEQLPHGCSEKAVPRKGLGRDSTVGNENPESVSTATANQMWPDLRFHQHHQVRTASAQCLAHAAGKVNGKC